MQMNCNKSWNEDKQLEMELATATASILPESNEDNTVSGHQLLSLKFLILISFIQRNGFGKTANGLKPQNIEVEFINIVDVTNGLEGRCFIRKRKEAISRFLQLIRLFILSHYQVALLGRYLYQKI